MLELLKIIILSVKVVLEQAVLFCCVPVQIIKTTKYDALLELSTDLTLKWEPTKKNYSKFCF